MSKFIVKPKKTTSESDYVGQEFEIFRRGRYGRHIQVGKITEYKASQLWGTKRRVEVRFERNLVPVTRPVLRLGQVKSWFAYEERNERISVCLSDIEAAKLFAAHLENISIWKQDWEEEVK